MSIKSLYPDIRPSLNLNFANSKALDGRITFTRNSTATYVGANGLIQTAQRNAPRFDHDPETGESLGLLIEESRTNLINNSTDFAIWADGTGSGPNLTLRWIQSNVAIAPDGTNTASKLIPSTQSDNQRIYKVIGATDQYLNQTLTFSVFAKAGEYSKIFIRSDSGNSGYMYVNLTDGSSFEIGSDVLRYSVDEYPNNWYRISLTAVESDSPSGNVPWISIVNDNDTYSFAGDGSEDGIYIWGAQVEVGSFPTSYIPTSGSTATRIADFASMTGTNFSSWYNPYESSILCNFTQNAPQYGSGGASGNERAYRFRATTGSDTRIDYVTHNAYHPYIAADGSVVANLTQFSNLYGGLENRTAVCVKENDFASFLNGNLKDSDTNGTWPPTNSITEVSLGSQSGGNSLNGHIKYFSYYPKRLTNAQLQLLTQ